MGSNCDEADQERPNEFQSVRVTPNVAQPVCRGSITVIARVDHGTLVRNRRIVETGNLTSANNATYCHTYRDIEAAHAEFITNRLVDLIRVKKGRVMKSDREEDDFVYRLNNNGD